MMNRYPKLLFIKDYVELEISSWNPLYNRYILGEIQ